MTPEVERIFRETGAVLEGHFLLSSGLHSPVYWEKFLVLQYPQATEKLAGIIARGFQGQGVQLVAGPTTGGVILAYEVARQLGVKAIYAEREGMERVFRRGLSLTPGERVLVVDDVITTGTSLKEVIKAVRDVGGVVIGAAVLVDRSQGRLELGVPLFRCHRVSITTYTPRDCPLCLKGIPITKPGTSPV